MAIVKNKRTEDEKAYWKHVEEVAEEVSRWPKWMGGDADDDYQNGEHGERTAI